VNAINRLLRRLRLNTVKGERPDSGDARAAAEAHSIASDISDSAGPGYPPGYVKDYDDGRPRT
jgi:hypothetical protein